MCGIAGIFSTSCNNIGEKSKSTDRMIQVLSHRGPDDHGSWSDTCGQIVLGHCRLAIIDLSIDGHQPMVSSCGRYTISFNGEIYNYVELKTELKGSGVYFHGNSDTEVLLNAVSQWGIRKALDKLIGMFAFALWDNADKRLLLARDRAGKKPLYYLRNQESLYFASEIKALKAVDGLNFQLDYDSIYQYLTFGYTPAPKTIFKNVFKVPAGHYITFDRTLNQKLESYWDIVWEKKRSISFDDAVNEVDSLLKEAIKVRLRADVPVGCFLSGGIDSGLLTAIASIQMDKPLKTFTVSFKDGVFDESLLANLIAKRYKTEHHVITLSPDLKDILPKVAMAYDEPFADPSAVPSYCVSEEAGKHLKVVLNGEGGDELFGGYRRYIAIKWFSQFRDFFKLLPESYYRRLGKIIPQPKAFRTRYAFAHRFIRGIVEDPFERYIVWCVDGFTEIEKSHLYKDMRNSYNSSTRLLSEKFQFLKYLDPLDHFMAIDFLLNMQDDMLVKMDIATMAHGLEGRNPFLDHRIIEWAISLPSEIRMKGTKTKPILRELAKRYLPDEIVDAPKRGFEIPLIKWLRNDLRETVYSMCLSPTGIINDLFDRKYVESLLSEKQRLDPDRWSRRVWILFMLAMWGSANK